MISFEWDRQKARCNARKHGVSFAEALSVFLDERAIQYFDTIHSVDEDRFIMLGLSSRLRLLVVVHAEREEGRIIRIVSARKATVTEQRYYRKRLI